MSSDNENNKVAFSLGGKKKKKPSSSSIKAPAADFGAVEAEPTRAHNIDGNSSNQPPLVIPLTQKTQSLLDRIKEESKIKQEGSDDNNHNRVKEEPATAPSNNNHQPEQVSSSETKNKDSDSQQESYQGDYYSREQLQKDLANLPDASEDAYEQVPVSQFGAALLRGMGWKDEPDNKSSNTQEAMPRPHRLGLGAIPKASIPDEMPSVLSGRNKRKKHKPTISQLQQQEEFERKRELQKKQDKQRTLQVGSIVYLDTEPQQRAKVIQLQGVPGLNMVSVQYENEAQPASIKRGQLGDLVVRSTLEQSPFIIPEPKSNGKERRRRDEDAQGNKHPGDREGRDRSQKRDTDRTEKGKDRRLDRDRDRSRSRSDERDRGKYMDRDRDHSRSRDRDVDIHRRRDKDRERDGGRDRRTRNRDRDKDSRRSEDKHRSRDPDMERDRERKKRRRGDTGSEDESDRDLRKGKRRETDRPSQSSRRNDRDKCSNPLWMIPNIRVRVVTEKFGKRYFRQKGVIVDVTRKHGATIKMDVSGSSSNNHSVLEHVSERYLETALPKPGGQAIVLTGPHKWAKGRLLERDSKTSKGSVQVFEDMSIITLSLDDMAEWCGPLDDDLA